SHPRDWGIITNASAQAGVGSTSWSTDQFAETKPISTYVFAFAAGPWAQVPAPGVAEKNKTSSLRGGLPPAAPANATPSGSSPTLNGSVFVRRSQLAKFQPHAGEVARLRDEGVKYLESYFDYKFPFPKLDLVLIPEFPFGGME